MYGLVPYNISDIQKGIQFGHGVVEYSNLFSNNKDYKDWALNDKVFIILNGGTTNSNPEKLGTMNQQLLLDDKSLISHLYKLDAPHATFHEEDLGDQLTSINFLVDELVYDDVKFPWTKTDDTMWFGESIIMSEAEIADSESNSMYSPAKIADEHRENFDTFGKISETEFKSILEFRKFLKQFKLA